MQFLYENDGEFTFMDNESFDQIGLQEDLVGDAKKWMIEGMDVFVMFHDTTPLGVEVPNFVELTVTETDPGFAGNTATNVTKPATLETGAEIKVPLFINPGDRIKIDTRTGEYLERAKG